MFFFPGGYSFINNYMSHLGLTIVRGLPNQISRFLFVITCVIWGVSFFPFFFIIKSLFNENNKVKNINNCSSFFGLLSSPFLIALAIIPLDVFLNEHGFSAWSFFFFFILAILIYSIGIFFNPYYKNIYAILYLTFSAFTFFFIFQIYPNYIIIHDMRFYIYPLIQKCIIYGYCIWIIIQVYKFWKFDAP